LVNKATVQWASTNLLPSEQIGAGGYSTVRGYDEYEASGDEGYLVNAEVRTPAFSIGNLFGLKKATDRLQALVFTDYGSVWKKKIVFGEDPHQDLWSIGPGLRYTISPYFSMRFDYGFQLTDTGQSTRDYNSRGHLGLVLSY
jgi:hemolysin activation/secretion protein